MSRKTDKNRGLYGKFIIERADGRSAPGKKHHGCDYYVLDLTHDKYAPYAIAAYAMACKGEFPALAADLFEKIGLEL